MNFNDFTDDSIKTNWHRGDDEHKNDIYTRVTRIDIVNCFDGFLGI